MLRTGGWGPHEVSGKASNTGSESHLAPPSNPPQLTFRFDSEMASKLDFGHFVRRGPVESIVIEPGIFGQPDLIESFPEWMGGGCRWAVTGALDI